MKISEAMQLVTSGLNKGTVVFKGVLNTSPLYNEYKNAKSKWCKKVEAEREKEVAKNNREFIVVMTENGFYTAVKGYGGVSFNENLVVGDNVSLYITGNVTAEWDGEPNQIKQKEEIYASKFADRSKLVECRRIFKIMTPEQVEEMLKKSREETKKKYDEWLDNLTDEEYKQMLLSDPQNELNQGPGKPLTMDFVINFFRGREDDSPANDEV